MKLQKANFENKKELLNIYQKKSIQELQKIQPKWAYGKYASNILDFSLHPQNEEYIIFLVETFELITNAELYEVKTECIFTGNIINDIRIASILNRWENNLFVDPPTIYLCTTNKNKLSFSDGRHRTKVTYLLGIKQIPIAVHNSQIRKVGEIVNLLPS